MDLTHDDVLQILDLLDRSDVEYFELRLGDTVIVANRAGTPAAAPASVASAPPDDAAPAAPAAASISSPPAGETVTTPAGAWPVDIDTPPAAAVLVDVTSPIVGVFYRAPEPGAAPFVEVGSEVQDGATIGLVEVMKMFNSVTASVSGSVAEILVENGEFVEFGQVLFRISPRAQA